MVSDWGLISRTFPVFIVGISWVKSTFLTYGPLHSLQTVPAMFFESRAEGWSDFARSTQRDLIAWRRERLSGYRRRGERKDGTWTYVFIWYEDTTPVKAVIDSRRWARPPKRQKVAPGWLQRAWSDLRMASTAPRFQRMVIALGFSVVYIYNTEYMVRINLYDGAGAWEFSQILPMATAVPFMASIIELAFRLGARDRVGEISTQLPAKMLTLGVLEALSFTDPAPFRPEWPLGVEDHLCCSRYGWGFGVEDRMPKNGRGL